MAMGRESASIGAAIRRKLSFWAVNTVQFFAQALPWSLKMKVKKAIGQA